MPLLNFSAAHARRLRWLNFPGAVLLALLQRTPAVRVAAVAEELVVRSPLGAVLRSAAATAAALGAVHSLAGATRVVATQGTTLTNSVNVAVGTAITPVVFVTTGAPTIALSYIITGLPPGLTVAGLNPSTNILNIANPTGTGQITGTPTAAGSYSVIIQAWEFANAQGNFSVPITILFTISASSATGPPTITTQPKSLVSAVGEAATLTVGVTANPAATFQWFKNGLAVAGATGASYAVASVSLTDAGNYTVNVTNSFGTVPSAAATLTVNAVSSSPVFTTQPVSQTMTAGATVVFTAAASGAPTPTYQWLRSSTTPGAGTSVQIAGATKPTLVLTGAGVITGNYSVIATNSVNAVTSKAATLSVIATNNPGHLKNLSVLTRITATEPSFTVATIIDLPATGTKGATKPLLVRAAGPSLGQFSVPDTLADPRLTLFQDTSVFSSNDNWNTVPGLDGVFTTAGADGLKFISPLEAAVYNERTPTGKYSVVVTGAADQTGNVIAEIYDATAGVAVATTAPRLINVSVLKQIPAASLLTAGFVIQGDTSLTVLIRAIGPGLAPYVDKATPLLVNPQLEAFDLNVVPSVSLARNDNWGGDSSLQTAMATVGAFPLTDTGSTDSILLLTLRPGSYSAQASGVGGGGGTAIVEVYEVR